ncbi:MAG: pyridoxal-dependent decarboxylase [Alphaproteobacteria bacterium]|nr:pyridoxal-dependent decarboxylase [Alphaproteobacteria bacterium]
MTGDYRDLVLSVQNREISAAWLKSLLDMGLDFKLSDVVSASRMNEKNKEKFFGSLNEESLSLEDVLQEFSREVLPYCTNFSSPNFLGFPDAGNSVAAMGGAILTDLLQQNLINQSFCAPSGTFVEIAVLRWLREAVGYQNREKTESVWDVGGIITSGGTLSNVVAMLLARENMVPDTMSKGVTRPEKMLVVVPAGIGHYSVKSAQMWIGCGSHLLEIDTVGFRYDLKKLESGIKENASNIMCVVAYAGDSRTQTIDNLQAVHDIVRQQAPNAWLHADACHGFTCGFSEKLRRKIKGIELFDSVSMDPHKVMATPYTLSALLVREPEKMRSVASLSDLIMQEQFAFGQATPFLGSKPWSSLKLWFMMKHFGKDNLARLVEHRHELAISFSEKIKKTGQFIQINEVDLNSVAFLYAPNKKLVESKNIDALNKISVALHDFILSDGQWHVHQFSIPDDGVFEKGATIRPLRLMPGNLLTQDHHLDKFVDYLLFNGARIAREMGEAIEDSPLLQKLPASGP